MATGWPSPRRCPVKTAPRGSGAAGQWGGGAVGQCGGGAVGKWGSGVAGSGRLSDLLQHGAGDSLRAHVAAKFHRAQGLRGKA